MSIRSTGILAATLIAAAGAPAMADYTPIGTTDHAGEQDLTDVIADKYGPHTTTMTQLSQGATFTTDWGYTFTRVHDFFDTPDDSVPTNLHGTYSGLTTDNRFSDGISQLKFVMRHAGYLNHLGWQDDADQPDYQFLINATTTPTAERTLSTDFKLTLNVQGADAIYLDSDRRANGASDQFVTWYVTKGAEKFWFIAVEDLRPTDGGADGDYNDFIFELSVIPLPPAAWAGLSTLAGVGLVGFVRRRRHLA